MPLYEEAPSYCPSHLWSPVLLYAPSLIATNALAVSHLMLMFCCLLLPSHVARQFASLLLYSSPLSGIVCFAVLMLASVMLALKVRSLWISASFSASAALTTALFAHYDQVVALSVAFPSGALLGHLLLRRFHPEVPPLRRPGAPRRVALLLLCGSFLLRALLFRALRMPRAHCVLITVAILWTQGAQISRGQYFRLVVVAGIEAMALFHVSLWNAHPLLWLLCLFLLFRGFVWHVPLELVGPPLKVKHTARIREQKRN